MRRAAKADINQPEIVQHLRDLGATVTPLHMVGRGCPDILVGFRGDTVLMEIKTPGKNDILTPDQVKWHSEWKGGKVYIVRSAAEAVDLLI